MYADSPYKGSNTHMLQSGIQNGWGELMPINIIKIWNRNNRSVMSQPLSNFLMIAL